MMGFEENTELAPFTAEQDQDLRQVGIERAPEELAAVEAATTDEEVFYALPHAAMAAWHLRQIDLSI